MNTEQDLIEKDSKVENLETKKVDNIMTEPMVEPLKEDASAGLADTLKKALVFSTTANHVGNLISFGRKVYDNKDIIGEAFSEARKGAKIKGDVQWEEFKRTNIVDEEAYVQNPHYLSDANSEDPSERKRAADGLQFIKERNKEYSRERTPEEIRAKKINIQKVALHEDTSARILEGIPDRPIKVLAGFGVNAAAVMAENKIEQNKMVVMGALSAAAGLALAAKGITGATALAVETLIDYTVDVVDNYATTKFDNRIGFPEVSNEDNLKNSLLGATIGTGINLGGKAIGKAIFPDIEKISSEHYGPVGEALESAEVRVDKDITPPILPKDKVETPKVESEVITPKNVGEAETPANIDVSNPSQRIDAETEIGPKLEAETPKVESTAKTPKDFEEVSVKDLVHSATDNLEGLPDGTSAALENSLKFRPDPETGTIDYSSKSDSGVNTQWKNLSETYDGNGDLSGYKGNGKYKGEDYHIEIPTKTVIYPTETGRLNSTLRLLAEVKASTVYKLDAEGNKVAIGGAEKVSRYLDYVVGETSVKPTLDALIRLSKNFERAQNELREQARFKNGVDLGAEEIKRIDGKIGWLEGASIEKLLDESIVASIAKHAEIAKIEFSKQMGMVTSDYLGGYFEFAQKHTKGELAKGYLFGDFGDDLSPALKDLLKTYSDLDDALYGLRKGQDQSPDSKAIVQGLKDRHLIEIEDGEIAPTEAFSKMAGGDTEDSIIDMVINRDLAGDSDSYLNKHGIKSEDDVIDVMAALITEDEFNAAVIGKLGKSITDEKVTKVMNDVGLNASSEGLSLSSFLASISKLGDNIREGIDVKESKDLLGKIFNKDESIFSKKDLEGNRVGGVSVADIISEQITGAGTSHRQIKKALAPIEKSILDHLDGSNKATNINNLVNDYNSTLKDMSAINDISQSILADIIPDYRPSSVKRSSLKKLVEGLGDVDRTKLEKTFKSDKFKKDIEKLRLLNEKHQFLEDDSLFYDLNIDNLLEAEKATAMNIDANKKIFKVTSDSVIANIGDITKELEGFHVEKIGVLDNEIEGLHAEILRDTKVSKRADLEAARETGRVKLNEEITSLKEKLKNASNIEEVKLEDARKKKVEKLTAQEQGVIKRKITLLEKKLRTYDTDYDLSIEKQLTDLEAPRNKEVFEKVRAKKAELAAKKSVHRENLKEISNYKKDIKQAIIETRKKISEVQNVEELRGLIDEDGSLKSIKEIEERYSKKGLEGQKVSEGNAPKISESLEGLDGLKSYVEEFKDSKVMKGVERNSDYDSLIRNGDIDIHDQVINELREEIMSDVANKRYYKNIDDHVKLDTLIDEIESGNFEGKELGSKKRQVTKLKKDLENFESTQDADYDKALKPLEDRNSKIVKNRKAKKIAELQEGLKLEEAESRASDSLRKEIDRVSKDVQTALESAKSPEELKLLLGEGDSIKAFEDVISKAKSDYNEMHLNKASDLPKNIPVLDADSLDGGVNSVVTLNTFEEVFGFEPSQAEILKRVNDPQFGKVKEYYLRYLRHKDAKEMRASGKFSEGTIKRVENGTATSIQGDHAYFFEDLGHGGRTEYTNSGGLNSTYYVPEDSASYKSIEDAHRKVLFERNSTFNENILQVEEYFKNIEGKVKGMLDSFAETSEKVTDSTVKDFKLKPVQLEADRLSKEIETMLKIKESKSISAQNAIPKVAQALETLMEKSKTVNAKKSQSKIIEAQAIRTQLDKLKRTIKENYKKDFTSTFENANVKKELEKYLEMHKAGGYSKSMDDVLPQDMLAFHNEILENVRNSISSSKIRDLGETARKPLKNRVNKDNLKMSKLAKVINKNAFLSDRSMFNLGTGKKPRYDIDSFKVEVDEGASFADFSDIDYKAYVKKGSEGIFEKWYDASKDLFAEVIDDATGEARNLNINEFAVAYYSFVRDLTDTRKKTEKWELGSKKTLTSLMKYFKDEEAFFEFMTLENIESHRSGYVKSTGEMLHMFQASAEQGSEYNALGMSKNTLSNILENSESKMVKDASSKLEVYPGESRSVNTDFWNEASKKSKSALGERPQSKVPKFVNLLIETLLKEMLFSSGTVEFGQLGNASATASARYYNKNYAIQSISGTVKKLPSIVGNSFVALPMFGISLGKSFVNMIKMVVNNNALNKALGVANESYLGAHPKYKSKLNYVNKILQEHIKSSGYMRHLENSELSVKTANSKSFTERHANRARQIGKFQTEAYLQMQTDIEFHRMGNAHEIAYGFVTKLEDFAKVEDIKVGTTKSLLTNMGVTDEVLSDVKDFMIRHQDQEGNLDLDLYNTSKMMENIEASDYRVANILSNLYNASYYKEFNLNKSQIYKLDAPTVFDKMASFLKNTTKGIAETEGKALFLDTDSAGQYYSRMGRAWDENGTFGLAKEAASTSLNILGVAFGLGTVVTIGKTFQSFWRDMAGLDKNLANLYAETTTKSDSEIDETSPMRRIANGILHLTKVGIKENTVLGVYGAGGNAFSDVANKVYKQLSEESEGDSDLTKAVVELLESRGVTDERSVEMAKKIFNSSIVLATTTLLKAIPRNITNSVENFNLLTEDGQTEELRVRDDMKSLRSKHSKSPAQQKAALEAYVSIRDFREKAAKMFSDNVAGILENFGGASLSVMETLKETGEIDEAQYNEGRETSHRLLKTDKNFYSPLSDKAKTIGDGISRLLNLKGADLDDFKFSYAKSIVEGNDPEVIANEIIQGAPNAVMVAAKGKEAYTPSQTKIHDEVKANYTINENEIPLIIAKSKDKDQVMSYALDNLEPKSKEAKQKKFVKKTFEESYVNFSRPLEILDKNIGGQGIFDDTYLMQRRHPKMSSELNNMDKMNILREDYYEPLKNVIDNEKHVNMLFPVAVAVGSSFVQNVYEQLGKDPVKTLEYIYQDRFQKRDVDGSMMEMVQTCAKYGESEADPIEDIIKEYENIDEEAVSTFNRNRGLANNSATGEGESLDIPSAPMASEIEGPKALTPKPEEIVSEIFNEVAAQEGSGDDVSGVKTGDFGMTEERKAVIAKKLGKNVSDKEASKFYIKELYDKLTSKKLNITEATKKTLVSTLYNMGEGVMDRKSFKSYAAEPNEKNLKELLFSTPTSDGLSVKGLAKRRAEDFNKSNPEEPVAAIDQKQNGDVLYLGEDGSVLYAYRAKGIHPKSKPGRIVIDEATGGHLADNENSPRQEDRIELDGVAGAELKASTSSNYQEPIQDDDSISQEFQANAQENSTDPFGFKSAVEELRATSQIKTIEKPQTEEGLMYGYEEDPSQFEDNGIFKKVEKIFNFKTKQDEQAKKPSNPQNVLDDARNIFKATTDISGKRLEEMTNMASQYVSETSTKLKAKGSDILSSIAAVLTKEPKAIDNIETLSPKIEKVLAAKIEKPSDGKTDFQRIVSKAQDEGKARGGYTKEWATDSAKFLRKHGANSQARKEVGAYFKEVFEKNKDSKYYKPDMIEGTTQEDRISKVEKMKLPVRSKQVMMENVQRGDLSDHMINVLEYITTNSKHKWSVPARTGYRRTVDDQIDVFVRGVSETVLGGNHLGGNALDILPLDPKTGKEIHNDAMKPYIKERDQLIAEYVKKTGAPIRIFHNYNGWDDPHVELFNDKNDPSGQDEIKYKQSLNRVSKR